MVVPFLCRICEVSVCQLSAIDALVVFTDQRTGRNVRIRNAKRESALVALGK